MPVRFHEGGSLRADFAYAYGDSGTDVDGMVRRMHDLNRIGF